MYASTREEDEERIEARWVTVPGDMEKLAEQCCDEFHGEIGTSRDSANARDRDRWRELAKFLWGLGARPMGRGR